MAELTWKTNPIEPPEAIEKLIADLRAGTIDERHAEWDIHFLMKEVVALFHAETVLHNAISNREISEEARQKREPFLRLAAKLTKAEHDRRLDEIYHLIGKLRGLSNFGQGGESGRVSSQDRDAAGEAPRANLDEVERGDSSTDNGDERSILRSDLGSGQEGDSEGA